MKELSLWAQGGCVRTRRCWYGWILLLITLEPRVEWYNHLWALNTSPPRNTTIPCTSNRRLSIMPGTKWTDSYWLDPNRVSPLSIWGAGYRRVGRAGLSWVVTIRILERIENLKLCVNSCSKHREFVDLKEITTRVDSRNYYTSWLSLNFRFCFKIWIVSIQERPALPTRR